MTLRGHQLLSTAVLLRRYMNLELGLFQEKCTFQRGPEILMMLITDMDFTSCHVNRYVQQMC
jgi:hypothetical protein